MADPPVTPRPDADTPDDPPAGGRPNPGACLLAAQAAGFALALGAWMYDVLEERDRSTAAAAWQRGAVGPRVGSPDTPW